MEEVLKLIAAGGGVGVSATWAYWLWRLEPRMRAIEEAIYIQAQVDLLRLIANSNVAGELKVVASGIIKKVEEKLAPEK